jgi:hypothetical protein
VEFPCLSSNEDRISQPKRVLCGIVAAKISPLSLKMVYALCSSSSNKVGSFQMTS